MTLKSSAPCNSHQTQSNHGYPGVTHMNNISLLQIKITMLLHHVAFPMRHLTRGI